MYRNLIVARNVDRASEIQYRVENSESFISCHIDLIENAETSVNGTLVDRTGAKDNFSVSKGIISYHGRGVHINMEREIIAGTAECTGKIFSQYIFSGCF